MEVIKQVVMVAAEDATYVLLFSENIDRYNKFWSNDLFPWYIAFICGNTIALIYNKSLKLTRTMFVLLDWQLFSSENVIPHIITACLASSSMRTA